MHFLAAVSILSSALLVAAQDTTIQVGSTPTAEGGFFQFIPPTVNATNGSVITFKFGGVPGNHTVTQSSFADPCNPLAGGFDSGFVYVPPTGLSTFPEWSVTITNDQAPIWFFCEALKPVGHCKSGMVGAINAPTTGDRTFAAFQTAAKAGAGTTTQIGPNLVGVGASASANPAPIESGATLYTGNPGPAPTGTAASGSSKTESGSKSSSTSGSSGGSYGGGGGSNGASSIQVQSSLIILGSMLGAAFVLA